MPIYEYLCEKCGHEFEREQRITDDPVKTCPQCRARRVRRLISRTGFVLKGGGWYSDLYASAKPAAAKDGDGAGGGSGESKPESKSESKADATPAERPKGGKKGTKARAA